MAAEDGSSSKKGKASANNNKKYVKKRPVPHLTELLSHGSEESRGKKTTWKQIFLPPLILAVLFFLSFLLFMKVLPHIPKNRNFQLPQRNHHVPKVSPVKTRDEQAPPQEQPKEEKIINEAEF